MSGRVMRGFDRERDLGALAALWRRGLGEVWPLSPGDIEGARAGLVAVDPEGRVVGFVGVDAAGSVPLILVAPDHRRQGVGRALLASAVDRLAALGVREVRAGSGGEHYIWPGVPENLPGAVAFFASAGWSIDHTTVDLTQDLRGYRTPEGVWDRMAAIGTTIRVARTAETPEVLAFEAAHFPNWLRWFELGFEEVLIARDPGGTLIGTLLFSGPKDDAPYAALLGPGAGELGCVGVLPDFRDRGVGTAMVAHASQILHERGTARCHIGWTVRERFYSRLGYRHWRRYHMFRRTTG
jgi:beta-N-acetylhexosaminidase